MYDMSMQLKVDQEPRGFLRNARSSLASTAS